MTDKPAVLRKLDAIYDQIPSINCKQLCGKTNCGPVRCTKIENRNIEDATGRGLQFPFVQINDLTCPHLENGKDCSIYPVRPLICRLFGVVDVKEMRCPHGCVPEKWMTHDEANAMMRAVYDLKR